MNEDRPRNWDWVSATHGCSALVMLSELKALARTNVKTRNEQLGEDRFLLMELDSVTFSVARAGEVTAQVWFKVTNDFTSVVISGFNGRDEITYGVGLDDEGRCRFKRAGERLDPWRVLKTHLEALLFSVR
jgi:hypothetical protein